MTCFFQVVTQKVQAFVTMCYRKSCVPWAQKSGFCERNHCTTVPCTATTFWSVGIPRCFFRGPISWKSFGGKLGQLGGCSRHSTLSWCNKVAAYRNVWYLGPSDPVPWRSIWWSQISNVAEVRESVLQLLCWQSPELYAASMHSLIPHFDQCLNHQDGQVVK